MSEPQTIIVALGGNALQDPDSEGTYDQQMKAVGDTANVLVDLVESKNDLLLTHGNGPQIGSIFRQNLEAADVTPPMPLFANGAESQGLIGYMIQVTMMSKFAGREHDVNFVPMVTPVRVSPDDEAFDEPTKPIGPFLSESQAADLQAQMDVDIREFSGRGYRQVVPSPEPVEVYGVDVVEDIVEKGDVPIVAGGGGVPVVPTGGEGFEGVNAVIDKDLAGAHLGSQVDADVFLILTDVPQVALNYGEPDQENLDAMTSSEARIYMEEGHFARGSMYEKVEAACRFVEDGSERKAIITKLDLAAEALRGEAGTVVEPE